MKLRYLFLLSLLCSFGCVAQETEAEKDLGEFDALLNSLEEPLPVVENPNGEAVLLEVMSFGANTPKPRPDPAYVTGRRLMIRQFLGSGAREAGKNPDGIITKQDIQRTIGEK